MAEKKDYAGHLKQLVATGFSVLSFTESVSGRFPERPEVGKIVCGYKIVAIDISNNEPVALGSKGKGNNEILVVFVKNPYGVWQKRY